MCNLDADVITMGTITLTMMEVKMVEQESHSKLITEPESIELVVKEKDKDMAIVEDIVKMVFNKS